MSEMTARVNANGKIESAYPEEGPDGKVWMRDQQSGEITCKRTIWDLL